MASEKDRKVRRGPAKSQAVKGKLRPKPISAEIAALAAHHNNDPEALIPMLQAIQAQHGGLTRAAIVDSARALGIPAQRAYGVATFYSMFDVPPRPGGVIRVCDGPVCWLYGAARLHNDLADTLGKSWRIERNSCLGLCDRAPAVLVDGAQCGPVSDASVLAGRSSSRTKVNPYAQPRPGEVRVLLAHAAEIDPDSIDSALEYGAYQGLRKALAGSPGAMVDEVEAAGLTGRGGAGFPTGRKWRMVLQEAAAQKYIVCNADESEPLVFKDRVLIDTKPQQLLEGMAIAGYAVGASEGYIYIRGEYSSQAERLERAVRQAEERGWLGERIQGSDFSFRIHIHLGAGAYICGEESALLESLEGKRGEPRQRPPFPTTHGFRGRPTVVNNVETLSSVPAIAVNGAGWYRSLGSSAPGTKLYLLLGHVNRPGLFEAPFGFTLRQIIDEFGGGMLTGSTFNFALTGGAAGTLVPPSLLDVAIDPGSWAKGVSLGAGAFLICDQSVSPAAMLRELMHFFESESCGKCTACRVGTHEARVILDRFVAGIGKQGDVGSLAELADVLRTASFCGLGQSTAIPMNSALTHFAGAFEPRSGQNG
jgi:NADH:ubiquinone oxidoreductase subunit F (NADH-binding)/NADH:ubiquinone oxidoreductase subunit E